MQGLSGQSFAGPDIGGFAGDSTPKLFARWMGLGAMLPFARGHSEQGTIDQEPWSFGPEVFCDPSFHYIPDRFLIFKLLFHIWNEFFSYDGGHCLLGGRSVEICSGEAISTFAAFLHPLSQGTHHWSTCDDSRIFCWYDPRHSQLSSLFNTLGYIVIKLIF